MNEELKTLKDLPHILEDGLFVSEGHLKAESVKHRKHIDPEMSVLDYIEWCFNLTEEDLKNE